MVDCAPTWRKEIPKEITGCERGEPKFQRLPSKLEGRYIRDTACRRYFTQDSQTLLHPICDSQLVEIEERSHIVNGISFPTRHFVAAAEVFFVKR